MSKDKAWLKDEIKKMGLISTGTILRLIDQLEEPKITEEQAWNKIAESYPTDARSLAVAFEHFYYEGFTKKELPIVPKFVADWIEYCKKGSWDVASVLSLENMDKFPSKKDIQIYRMNHADTLARAFLYGYEVEKEPRWVVKTDTGYLNYLEATPSKAFTVETSTEKEDAIFFYEELRANHFATLVDGIFEEVTE